MLVRGSFLKDAATPLRAVTRNRPSSSGWTSEPLLLTCALGTPVRRFERATLGLLFRRLETRCTGRTRTDMAMAKRPELNELHTELTRSLIAKRTVRAPHKERQEAESSKNSPRQLKESLRITNSGTRSQVKGHKTSLEQSNTNNNGGRISPRQMKEVVQRLHDWKEEINERRKQRQEAHDRKVKECTFHPRLGKRTSELGGRIRVKAEEGVDERRDFLYEMGVGRLRSHRIPDDGQEESDTETQECTFTPTLSQESRELASKRVGDEPFMGRCASWLARRDARIERERAERECMLDEECTFRPSLGSSHNRSRPTSASRSHPPPSSLTSERYTWLAWF